VTHSELTEVAKRWLLNHSCRFAGTEQQMWSSEIPDAIGWDGYISTVIEVKTNRADFLADAKKPHRVNPIHALGQYRYYLVPQGLVTAEDIPEGWGLLEHRLSGHKAGYYVKKILDAPAHKRDRLHYREEVRCLVLMASRFVSAMRTLHRFGWSDEPGPVDPQGPPGGDTEIDR